MQTISERLRSDFIEDPKSISPRGLFLSLEDGLTATLLILISIGLFSSPLTAHNFLDLAYLSTYHSIEIYFSMDLPKSL